MSSLNISVIIPCYNASKTIRETLDSLKAQTLLPFEVICVNDGSRDDTENVIAEYCEKEPQLNIKLISQENAGVSVARNIGIEVSTGEILVFIDADDKFSPAFLKSVVDGMEQGYDTVYGYFTHDESQIRGYALREKPTECERMQIMHEFMYDKGRFYSFAYSYKREIIDKHAIRFEEGVRYGEDWEFTTKYLDACRSGLQLHEYVLFYRIVENSVTHTLTYAHTDAIGSAQRAEEYLKDSNSDFYGEFASYMKHRAVFSVAHVFSKYRAKELYKKLLAEYDVKKSMKKLSGNKNISRAIRLAALSFVISPSIFYNIVGRR